MNYIIDKINTIDNNNLRITIEIVLGIILPLAVIIVAGAIAATLNSVCALLILLVIGIGCITWQTLLSEKLI